MTYTASAPDEALERMAVTDFELPDEFVDCAAVACGDLA